MVRQLKEQPGKNILILGSNNLSVRLMQAGLADELQILVNPVVFGAGTSLFKGLPKKAELRLAETRRFKSGGVLLTYLPIGGQMGEEITSLSLPEPLSGRSWVGI